jgi:hypothetical protein
VPGCYKQTKILWQCSIPDRAATPLTDHRAGRTKSRVFCGTEGGGHTKDGLRGLRRSTLGFGVAIVFDEPGLVVAQEILYHLDPAEAGGDAFLLLEEAVVCERFADLHDFDMTLLGFPKLALGEGREWGRGFFLHSYQGCIVPKFQA